MKKDLKIRKYAWNQLKLYKIPAIYPKAKKKYHKKIKNARKHKRYKDKIIELNRINMIENLRKEILGVRK